MADFKTIRIVVENFRKEYGHLCKKIAIGVVGSNDFDIIANLKPKVLDSIPKIYQEVPVRVFAYGRRP